MISLLLFFIVKNTKINQMSFIRGTKYVFYELNNTDKNVIYHGIIDIVLNKVIFHTDEKINSFKPYIENGSVNSMLIITDKSAYRICALIKEEQCLDSNSCQNDETFIINSYGPNYCGNRCQKFLLLPNKICIDKCDENIFYTNDSYHCGFCNK